MGIIKEGKCGVEKCEKKLLCRGMCAAHYRKFIRKGGNKVNNGGICSVEGCDRSSKAKGLCNSHYMKIRRTGSPDGVYEKHGLHDTKEYSTWASMKQRCFNPNSTGYADYGGRNITMSEEWKNSFTKFYQDVGVAPSPEHSIERIDVNGNYELGNVVWAIKSVQAHNQRIRRTNTSGFKGISFRKDNKKWAASIAYKGQRRHLGMFNTPEEASEAYELAAAELFSEYEDVIAPNIIDEAQKRQMVENKQKTKIMRRVKLGANDVDCWEWIGYIGKSGYGSVDFKGVTKTAHRAVYEILVGEIPGKMQLNHDCHTRSKTCAGGTTCLHRRCVNPDHMSLVTPLDNLLLDNTVVGLNAKRTHCFRGHELTPQNTRISYATGSKVRFCKACDKIRNERHKSKRRKMLENGGKNLDPRTKGKTHCSNGHELTDETIKYGSNGYYYCTLCQKAKQERHKAKHHEKMLAEGREIRVGPKLKTHCKYGHPFDEANTYTSPSDGRRHCRICLARIARDQRAKQNSLD